MDTLMHDDAQEAETSRAQQEIAALERQIDNLPPELRGGVQDKLRAAVASAGPGRPPELNAIVQEVSSKQTEANAEEAKKIQQTLGGAVAGLVGFGLAADAMQEVQQAGKTLFGGVDHTVGDMSFASLMTPATHPGMAVAALPATARAQGVSGRSLADMA
jgi:hypothetical protein